MVRIRRCAGLCLLVLLAGCDMRLEDFRGTEPRFVPEAYFIGTTRAWGVFQDRFGRVRRQFVVDIEGRLDGEVLVLDEIFSYADGATQERTWRLRPVGERRYEGRAEDVVGTAAGEVLGQAFHLEYDLEIEIGGDLWQVHFEDWLLLQPGGVVINRATVTKFGVTIGEMSAFFYKPDER